MVAGLPKQLLVSAMRLDVVNTLCCRRAALSLALGAEGMPREERTRVLSPAVGIPTLVRGAALSVGLSCVCWAEAVIGQCVTAWVIAWMGWTGWHQGFFSIALSLSSTLRIVVFNSINVSRNCTLAMLSSV